MDPWIATLYSIPVITIVPLIIIWFGIGMISKIIVVFKITAVAIILNTAAGIKNLDPVWLELAKSLRLSALGNYLQNPLSRRAFPTSSPECAWASAARCSESSSPS